MSKKKAKPKPAIPAMLPASKLDLENPKPGLYLGVPFDDYLDIDAFSASQAKEILKSPAHLKKFMASPPDKTHLRLGSLTDCMLFEPDTTLERYAKIPETYKEKGIERPWSKRGNSNTARTILTDLERGGKVSVKRDDWMRAESMYYAIRNHHGAMSLLETGIPQVTMIWIDPGTGILCRARVDWWTDEHIDDLKTTKDGGAHQLQWPREIKRWNYHVQVGAYLTGREILTGEEVLFHWIVAEKEDPFNVMAYMCEPDTVSKGENDWQKACVIYEECKRLDYWGGYSNEVEISGLYSWDLNAGVIPDIGVRRDYEF